VEDERRLAAEGFAVEVALDGTDGLWMAREHPYDLIVLDIMLPGVYAYRLCSALRGDRNCTPILILTAKERELDEVEALDSGANDHLTKPFSYAVLVGPAAGVAAPRRPRAPGRAHRRATCTWTLPPSGPGGASSRSS
jgi:two-component system, OmpR family, response regulator